MDIHYKYLDLHNYNKTYVISDLHANLDIFNKFIDNINFTSNDLLIINGDIFEKGKDSLLLIRRIMELSHIMNIEIVLGNNDTIFNEWGPYYENSVILRYMNGVTNSILIDIANEAHLNYRSLEDMDILYHKIHSEYTDIVDFLKDRPHILETENYIFVHAGIEDKDFLDQTYEYLLTAKAFAYKKNNFDKTIIVGHWPSSNYAKDIIDINPFFNNNVISIDGGISLKPWAQLNYLIITNNELSFDYIDNLDKIRILEDQKESETYYSLIYPNTACTIIEDIGNEVLVWVDYINQELKVPKEELAKYRNTYYINDYTNYHLSLNKGDIVSFIERKDDEILIKKQGKVGLFKGKYEFI